MLVYTMNKTGLSGRGKVNKHLFLCTCLVPAKFQLQIQHPCYIISVMNILSRKYPELCLESSKCVTCGMDIRRTSIKTGR